MTTDYTDKEKPNTQPKNSPNVSLLNKNLTFTLFVFSPNQRPGSVDRMIISVIQSEVSYERSPAPSHTSSSQKTMLFYLQTPSILSVP